ncbi:MAG: EpsI family protein [Kiritimatiellae bacterium]|nr:EpsI family protein [Kiritimatiellia bacterium]MDW8457624.1 exosortase-associated EpsI family protein [Verrucomicrobiota bacterium]
MKPSAALWICTAILAALFAAQPHLTKVTFIDEPPVPTSLPEQVGAWQGRRLVNCQAQDHDEPLFEDEVGPEGRCPICGGVVGPMTSTERYLLPPDTRIDKRIYRRRRDAAADAISAAIVFSGIHRASIHRPEVCLVGDGSTAEIIRTETRRIPLAKGQALGVSLLTVRQFGTGPDGKPVNRLSYFAYWFIGRGRETPSHVERLVWMGLERIRGRAYPWAYVSISAALRSEGDSAALRRLDEFARALHGALHALSSPGPVESASVP